MPSCLICLQNVKDPSIMSSLEEFVSVEDNLNFSICELIYLIADVKLEVKQNIYNICPSCVNGAIQAFKFKQMCLNAGQHEIDMANKKEHDVKVNSDATIKVEKPEDDDLDISETFLTYTGPVKVKTEIFDANMEVEEIKEADASSTESLPAKSKEDYQRAFDKFEKWRISHNGVFSESDILDYKKLLADSLKPASLWAKYSMLKAIIKRDLNIDVSSYPALLSFLKLTGNEYKSQTMLTSEQIDTFLIKADDEIHLLTKVVIIFGICGGCSRSDLSNLKVTDIVDHRTHFSVSLRRVKANRSKTFTIPPLFYGTVAKYWNLRPTNFNDDSFFVNYFKGRCTRVAVGINKLSTMPKKVAEFLKLPNPERYTGHAAMRRSIEK